MINKNTSLLYCIFLLTLVCFSSCKDEPLEPLVYDPAQHVYAHVLNTFHGEEDNYEAIIELSSGRVEAVPGSETRGNWQLPSSIWSLTDFAGNRRIFVDPLDIGRLLIEELGSSERRSIELIDPDSGLSINRFRYLNFGDNQNEVYGLSSSRTVYKVDLETEEVVKVVDRLVGSISQEEAFMYLPISKLFLIVDSDFSDDENPKSVISVYDPNEDTSNSFTLETILLGFQRYPGTDELYALTYPDPGQGTGFRLAKVQSDINNASLQIISQQDLSLENITVNMHTIHSATNSFVSIGSTSRLDDENENRLFQVDLTTGMLKRNVRLDNTTLLNNLSGE